MAQIDQGIMTQLKDHALQLRAQHAARDAMFAKYDEMYLLDWTEKNNERLKHMQITASPTFRNQVQGAVRLMIATDPQINIEPSEKTKTVNVEKVEGFLNDTLYQSGRLAGEPVHYPLITTAMLYDEMHAAITSTADMLAYAKSSTPSDQRGKKYRDAAVQRWEEIADTTPFLVEPWNPSNGYPEFSTTGITAYYRVIQTTAGEVMDRFGRLPQTIADVPRNSIVYLHTFFDPVYTAVWIDGQGGDLLLEEHGLPRIPVIAQIVNGSLIFHDKEDQRQPFGYTMLKSGLWNGQNLALTAMFTNVLNQAWTPTKVYTPAVPGSQIQVDHDQDIINLQPGDRLDFVQSKGLIDPAQREAYQLADELGSASTIYPQALGASLGGNQTYSEISLLQQAGRLPLIGPQRRGGWGMSAICETMLAMMRTEARYRNGTGLTVADMPRGIEVKTRLEVSLPQDKLQQANILNILTNPQDPKVSTAWALENVLGINDPEDMRRQIWNERTTEQLYQMTVARLLQQAQQQQQAQAMAAMQQQGGGMGGPGAPGFPGGPAGGPPPGPGMQAGPTANPGGPPMQGGLPQAQAGMIPGQGGIMAPPQDNGMPPQGA